MKNILEIITSKESENKDYFDPITITIKIRTIEDAKYLYKALEFVNRETFKNVSGWSPWLELQGFLKTHIINNVFK